MAMKISFGVRTCWPPPPTVATGSLISVPSGPAIAALTPTSHSACRKSRYDVSEPEDTAWVHQRSLGRPQPHLSPANQKCAFGCFSAAKQDGSFPLQAGY